MDALRYIQKEAGDEFKPKISLSLGSGLGSFAEDEDLDILQVIPYSNIPNFPSTSVEGHSGNLILASLDEVDLVLLQGRIHPYEAFGWDEPQSRSLKWATLPLRVMKGLGVDAILTSCAVGAIDNDNNNIQKGDIGLIIDHTDYIGCNPLMGLNDERFGPRFTGKKELYSSKIVGMFSDCMDNERLHPALYITSPSTPQYEGVADIMRSPQIEEVVTVQGMSYGMEAPVITQCNENPCDQFGFDRPVEHLGFALFTNIIDTPDPLYPSKEEILQGASVKSNPATHEEVMETGIDAQKYFVPAMKKFIRKITTDL
ncbi:hypothetical protein GF362_06175 [Candidatus Dojkabacteria bacterium]|nr:hypothetical protein [Candidatus Dojkabacteria bacterium]